MTHDSPKLRVVIAGSKLFAPTLTSLAAFTAGVAERHDVRVFAKYPQPHPLAPKLRLERIDYAKAASWPKHFDLAHLLAGDTAARILEMLPEDFPVVLTCEAGGDFTRRIQQTETLTLYERQFERAHAVVFIHKSTAELARQHCCMNDMRVHILDPCLPLAEYPLVDVNQNTRSVAVVGREVPEKGRAKAEAVLANHMLGLSRIYIIGSPKPELYSDERFIFTGIVSHADYLSHLMGCRALLYMGAITGNRYDSLPTTFLEAFALGIPVASTPIAGARELSTLFPKSLRLGNTEGELSEQLKCLIDFPPNGEDLSAYARERFSLSFFVNSLSHRIYQEAIS